MTIIITIILVILMCSYPETFMLILLFFLTLTIVYGVREEFSNKEDLTLTTNRR